MRAYQFLTEEKKVTVYTDPSYQGATLDDKYWNSKPSQKIDFDKLEPFEPESKMKAKKSADNMKRFVDKIKAGEEIKPIIVTPKDGKYLILDGHHRYFAARIAKVDSMEAVIVPSKSVTFTDEVPDESEQHKQEYHKEEAAGVGIVTKQNATADVPVGGEYMNVKKLFPKKKKKKESVAYEDMFQGLNPKSEIYVDMDGVLADFFSRWQKITGKNWRDIKGDDLQPALQAIRDDDDFWLDLPLTSNAKKLLGIIKQVKGSYKILSAPLAGDKKAEPHKREWVAKNLDFFPPTEVIITKDKAKYATNPDGTPNILIDDYGVNIAAWESAGGIGFKHKDHKFERTAKKLKAEIEESFQHLMRNYIEEGREQDTLMKGALGDARRIYDNDHGYGSFYKLPLETQQKLIDELIKKRYADIGKVPPKYKSTLSATQDGNKTTSSNTFGEGWSKKYKRSINCSNPKGFSQKAHCAGRKKKTNEGDIGLYPGALRGTVIDLISDKIEQTDDVEKLAYWLKMIVGRTIKPRGNNRYTITGEDVLAAIEQSALVEGGLAKKIGAGALAAMIGLSPVSKAMGQDADTSPLPNKQTTTMVQKDVAGKKDLSKIQAPAEKDFWKVTIDYKGKDVQLKLPFEAGTNKKQIKQFVDDMMSDQGVKDYSVKNIDTLNKVPIDQSILKKLIKELEKRNGKQSDSYLSGMAERAGAKPGEGGAYAIAAKKAYHGL